MEVVGQDRGGVASFASKSFSSQLQRLPKKRLQPQDVVGKKITTRYALEGNAIGSYPATVMDYSKARRKYLVRFDDGTTDWLDIGELIFDDS